MHTFDTKYQNIIYAVMTNKELTDDERSKIIADFIEEFKSSYPNLEHASTKHELTETELRLTKEIEATRLEIKEVEANLTKDIREVEANLTKDIREVEANLTKEIEATRLEIKEVEANLTKDIRGVEARLSKDIANSKVSTIKWVAGMLFMQVIAIGGLFLTAFKLFAS